MTIYRDEVSHYIRKHGGRIHIQQTAHDDCEVYLIDGTGNTVGEISPFDRNPKPVCKHVFADMPY